MTTFQDSIDLLVDYLGGNPTDTVQRDCRRAVLEAYRDLTNAFRWSYLFTHGRLATVAPQGGGTVGYVQATRLVTLTPPADDPTLAWPAWAAGAVLRVGQVNARVAKVVGPTTLLLDDPVNFGGDVEAGTEYRLFRDSYLLPRDFIANDRAMAECYFGGIDYVHPSDWMTYERYYHADGPPRAFTIVGDALYPGRLVIRFFPAPDDARTIDYLYLRTPRPLAIARVDAGTVALDPGGTTVTGVGTAFHAGMVGSLFRASATTAAPTAVVGKNPAVLESIIVAYTSPTAVELADPAPQALAGVACTVSDRVDVEEQSMLNAFNRCCEMHLSMNRTLKDKPSAAAQYRTALSEARSADSRSFAGRSVGDCDGYPMRLRDRGPVIFNQS